MFHLPPTGWTTYRFFRPHHLFGIVLAAMLLALPPADWAKAEQAADQAGMQRHIILQLPWRHQFQFASYYAAVEQGYYQKAGFDVTIQNDNPGSSPVAEVPAGFLYNPEPELDYAILYRLAVIAITLLFATAIGLLIFFTYRMRQVLKEKTASLVAAEDDLLASDALYRTLFNNVPVGIGLIGLDGSIFAVNNKVLEITGYTRREALRENVSSLYFNPADRQKTLQQIRENGFVQGMEFKLKRKDGTPFDGRFTSVLVSVGGEQKMLSMVEDLSQQKQLEEEQLKVAEKLERLEKMEAIGLMAGGVAHDLNNILSGIVSYPELLLMKLPKDSDLRKPIQTIQQAGSRAAAVVADLLTVARGAASIRETANLNRIIEEYFTSPEGMEVKELHREVSCITNLLPELANIFCSPVHIRKCLMNLILNAAEAIEDEGTIVITTRNQYLAGPLFKGHKINQGQYAVLSVSDTGSGIEKKDIEHIFEPFYTKKVMGRSGTGLGLTVVWNTVQDHGGIITVDSSRKRTVFELYFPATTEEPAAGKPHVEMESLKGSGETVLVVDDEPQQREIASQILLLLGYRVATVASGEQAVHYLRSKTADLLLLDMLMAPGINGRETYEQIISIHPEQKALIASGFSHSDDINQTLCMGAGGFVKKPYTVEQLGKAIQKVLGTKHTVNTTSRPLLGRMRT
ncbi:MAG: response regulator [Deltaproteobacteria bacterium]|nr:response regulator [Candidatus Anaeroferrophillus wilburensis]MBN2888040.1 response regulator [Deltaproteobacteria bacterium]